MKQNIVVAGHPLTTQAGIEILEAGGNAYDAILAAFLVSCVAEATCMSLGGGGFLVACPQDAKNQVFDFFTQTPQKNQTSHSDLREVNVNYTDSVQTFHIGMGSIAVPGNIAAVFDVHKKLGSLPIKAIFEPAILAAKSQVPLNGFHATSIDLLSGILYQNPFSESIFYHENRQKKKEGDTFHIPFLADSLDVLSREGKSLFYEGEMAQQLVKDCREKGGFISLSDLKEYQVEQRKPLTVKYKDSSIYSNPPPSAGGVLISFSLKLAEKFELHKYPFGSAKYIACVTEISRLTNQARVQQIEQATTTDDAFFNSFLAEQNIDHFWQKNDLNKWGSTTHISVIDKAGNAASLTHSSGEGSAYFIPETGIMLNNMLGEADLNPRGLNNWLPNQRIASMMSPTIIADKKRVTAVLGTGGANRIRSATTQTIFNLLDHKMNIRDAIEAPRMHLEDTILHLEGAFDKTTVESLQNPALQYNLWEQANHMFFGGMNGIHFENGQYVGYGDSRRCGVTGKC